MKLKIFFYIIIININTYFFIIENNDIIRFAFILSRTGSHSPSKLKQINYETYKDIFGYEWIGQNELTNIGKTQQFYLGCLNNYKYKNILFSEIFHPKELKAYSSESNRTIQSSYANLHGLYPNSNITLTDIQINNAIPPLNSNEGYIDAKNELDKNKYALPNSMQVVPVNTFDENLNRYLLEKVENCPNLKDFYEEGESLAKHKIEEILNYKSENNEKMTYGEILIEIINQVKMSDEVYTINNLKNNITLFKLLAETFICDYFNAVNLDKFIQKGINIYKLLEMFEDFFGELSIGGGINNPQSKRANKTYEISQKVNYNLFNNLLEWTSIRIDNDIKKNFDLLSYDAPKIVLYLSHHRSIESLIYFLKETFNIKNAKIPLYVNFTSFIGIELYRRNNNKDEYSYNDFYVKFIYDDQQIGNDISYNEFSEKLKEAKISTKELLKYCGFNENNEKVELESNINYKITGSIITIFIPILSSLAVFLFIKSRKKKDFNQFSEQIRNESKNGI